ncbi:MAG: bifunctional phosphoribosylaminoimidazolecarboxamide formyltransferase/IMP cyclohydrolase [Myxococcales bacterium]|nr:bifunctional phosphoribosylaminoimidazolecarboxamide formyltransferase/IMP cyclohydrolase [Myxococcales bacterium]
MRKIALLSCSDKEGLLEFAVSLLRAGYTIVSTGGTAGMLYENGVPVEPVESITRVPEMLDGRVKTLHPAVHGGILARRDIAAHMETLARWNIAQIDVVCVNLYPFRETLLDAEADDAECIEQIDIGGPAMVRSAAKNHGDVVVVVDPADYADVGASLGAGNMSLDRRRALAAKAFQHVAEYDTAVARWLANGDRAAAAAGGTGLATAPGDILVHLGHPSALRYGENPHQKAWRFDDMRGTAALTQRWTVYQGKELGYNNLVDADAAWQLLQDLPRDQPAACVVKHANPCGVGSVPTSIAGAVMRAIEADPIAAFGGVLALNRPLDLTAMRAIGERFLEVVLAPGFDEGVLEELAAKPNLRVIDISNLQPGGVRMVIKPTVFGVLAQEPDAIDPGLGPQVRTVTKLEPSANDRKALDLLWRICKHVKSNAIVIGDERGTIGIGAGQMSRVDAATIACGKARKGLKATAAASDAFFPFPDGVETLARAGIKAIVQPGGSKKDAEVIAAADALGVAMLLTGTRHFRH